MLATDSTSDSVVVGDSAVDAGVSAALTTTVDCCWFDDVEFADTARFVRTLPAKFGAVCGALRRPSRVREAAVAARVSGVAASGATGDETRSAGGVDAAGWLVGDAAVCCWVGNAAVGGWAEAAVATAEGASVWVGVAPEVAVVSRLDGGVPPGAPTELFTVPERRSALEASRGEEVELAFAPPLRFTVPGEEEPVVEADDFVDESGSDDGVLAADSDDELEADDELEELVSVGSADATPGVFATAAPTPSTTANAPARTRYCGFTGTALEGQSAR